MDGSRPIAMRTGLGLCVIAGILASGTVGFLIGRRTAPRDHAASSAHVATERTAGTPARKPSDRISPAALVAELNRESDPLKRVSTAVRHMEDWVGQDAASALEWLLQQPVTGRRNELIQMALAQWAETDPASAASWTMNHLAGIEKGNTLIRIAEQWAHSDPGAAAQWFSAIPAGDARVAPLEGIFFRWASGDPHAAQSFLTEKIPHLAELPVLTQAMLAGWAKADPLGAVAQSLATSKQSGNPALFANTIANWATMDVDSSASWLLRELPPGPERTAAIPELAAMYAHQAPSSGLQWIDRLSDGEKPAAHTALVQAWVETDPAAAARWLGENPASQTIGQDTLTSVMLGYLSRDEAGFQQWKSGLPTGPLREMADRLSALPEDEP